MFDNTIEFIANEAYFDNPQAKKDFPKPTKFFLPQWYKEIKTSRHFKTIKSCIPFLDSLTTGYTLSLPQDIYIKHNYIKDGVRGSTFEPSLRIVADTLKSLHVNINTDPSIHPIEQVGNKCPFAHKNMDLPFYKIHSPWIIKTPPGYSCLFVPPLNNRDDRFEIISGIVDTDEHTMMEVNFPFVINGDKYPHLETVLERGTPYAQVIPFKREKWKMKVSKRSIKESTKSFTHFSLLDKDIYKKLFWKKKSWK